MSVLVDTHCHLDGGHLAADVDAILERARAQGVGAFVAIGVDADLGAARAAVALAHRRTDVFAAIGVHPHDAVTLTDAALAELRVLAADPRVVAIGETGLDFHYNKSPPDAQRKAFAAQIALARELGKPIVVHTRQAGDETIALLEAERAAEVGGIIHCFSEDRAFAERALALDFDLSFSGIVTFKSARAIQDVAAWAPDDRILVETDSPFLAPVPLRGKTCEPAFVVHTARRVAELRGQTLDALAERTTANAVRRLRLPL